MDKKFNSGYHYFDLFPTVHTSLHLCPDLSGWVQVSFITKVRKERYLYRSLLLLPGESTTVSANILGLSRPAIWGKSNNFTLRPWRHSSDVCLDSLSPSSQTHLFMVLLIYPDRISPLCRPSHSLDRTSHDESSSI